MSVNAKAKKEASSKVMGENKKSPKKTREKEKKETKLIPFLPLRDVVVFPGLAVPLQVSRKRSCDLIEKFSSRKEEKLVVLTQLNAELDEPGKNDFHLVGCLVSIIKKLKFPDGSIRVIVQGQERVCIDKIIDSSDRFIVQVKTIKDVPGKTNKRELTALAKLISAKYQKILSMMPEFPEELQISIINIEEPSKLADFIASTLNLTIEEKISLLEMGDLSLRLKKLSTFVQRELEVVELGNRLQDQVQSQITKAQKTHFLKEQMRLIRHELGDQVDESAELDELRSKVRALGLDEKIEQETLREINRIEHMPPGSSETAQLKTWVEWVTELPWNTLSQDDLNLKRARQVLDEDHSHLSKVKERILEFLAVRKLRRDPQGAILCLSGPPGVGKTSLGRSIARAMNREFIQVSVGGLHDEAEIRGHRRTYIGAMPGRILKELKRCGTRNPVFMLDEVDKITRDYRGDPASALLEVLDSEQNKHFQDNYLNFPFDLSEIFFICTVNRLDTIPPALRDRLEVIHLEGYTLNEKVEIAQKHLMPQQLKEHGLRKKDLSVTKKMIEGIIFRYTREAGVRQLKRNLAALCRKAARKRVEGSRTPLKVTDQNLKKLLDRDRIKPELIRRQAEVGVATGMAWTAAGGAILNIEAALVDGRRPILVTGSLGDVMKESARLAYTLVKRRLPGVKEILEKKEIHVHVPAGAIPKDGPSAGITMAIALMSLLQNKPIHSDIAMTGELTLTGRVLPVGGIKSKVLAAQRSGAKIVILPKDNQDDLDDLPQEIKSKLNIKFVETIDDVFRVFKLTLK